MTDRTLQDMQVQMLMGILETNPDKFDNIEKKCNGKNTLEEIFGSMWNVDEAETYLSPKIMRSGKSDEEADKLRKEGNEFYNKLEFEKALEYYNLSIMAAQHPVLVDDLAYQEEFMDIDGCIDFPRIPLSRYGGSAEAGKARVLAKSFANRSAIMFELAQYEKCLKDIKYAFEFGYPQNLSDKLEERRQKCKDELQQFIHADRDSGNMDVEEQDPPPQAWRLSQFSTGDSQEIPFKPSLKDRVAYRHHRAPVLTDPNSSAPSLSSAVKIVHIPSKGRAVVATRNIKPGEILGVEKAYSVAVDLDKLSTNCSYCFALCLTPLPCPSCTKVVYCDESCRAKALSKDHWLECNILPTIIAMKSDEITIAYKLLKTFSYDHMDTICKQLADEIFHDPNRIGFSQEGIYSSSSYRSVYNLCDNRDKYTLEPLVKLVQRSLVLTKVLQSSQRFYVKKTGEAMKPAKEHFLRTGSLMLSHLMKYVANAYSCQDIQGKVGRGIFPTASLINHSCNPSVFYGNRGRELILRAWRPIAAGEEITVAYDAAFEYEAKEERSRSLRYKYFFTCSCKACEEGWPTNYKHFPMKDKCFVCKQSISQSSVACKECAQTIQGQKVVSSITRMNRIAIALRSRSPVPRVDFKFLLELNELVHREFNEPSATICTVRQMLHRCFNVGF